MAKTGCARIVLCLLAVVLIEAATLRIGFAAEAAGTADHPAASDSKGGHDEDAKGEGGGARNADPPSSDVKVSDPIDTRITVQPHHSASGRDDGKDARTKLRFIAPTFRGHRFSRTQTLGVARNAIGIPLPRGDAGKRRNGEHLDSLAAPHEPAAGTLANDGSGAGHTNIEGHRDRPVLNPNQIVRPTAPTHGVINGTGVVQRGSGPPRIGGPATSVTGINGTTIRPKH
jgi:hypothetical protein